VNERAPVLQALVLADHIYTDGPTGKRVICGTFSKIWCKDFPGALAGPIWAFILLVEAIGDVTIQLRLVHLESNKIIAECNPITIHSDDPLVAQDLAIQMPGFPLPKAGTYSFDCWANGTMIGSVRLQVVLATQKGEESA